MKKIKITYTDKQRQVLYHITSTDFKFAHPSGKAINTILMDMRLKFSPSTQKKRYQKTLKYHQAHALVIIARILQGQTNDPLETATIISIIHQIEPKL